MCVVLIIDDDVGTREGFEWTLRAVGVGVATAPSAEDGLELARKNTFDVILADLRLPDMTGLELLRQLRFEGFNTPFVIMTAFGSVESAVDAMRLGAVNYVEKPLVGDDIVRLVSSAARTPALAKCYSGQSPDLERLASIARGSSFINSRVSAALQTILSSYTQAGLSVSKVARDLGVSTEHLCRMIKRDTGEGFGAHLHGARIRAAQQLLRETNLSVKEIAGSVGYQRTGQLDHHFHKLVCSTPMEYRQTIGRPSSVKFHQ